MSLSRTLTAVTVAVAVAVMATASCGGNAKDGMQTRSGSTANVDAWTHEAAMNTPETDFQCQNAAATLGHPGATVSQCKQWLPGFWRVVLEAGGVANGVEVFRVIWRDGQRRDETGLGAFARWMKANQILSRSSIERWPLGELMETLGALPAGFSGASLSEAMDPTTGAEGSVVMRPLRVTLYQPGYDAPAAKPASAAPPTGPSPPPAGPAAPPAGPGPSGPPAGPGPAGPPPGGFAPTTVARATLTATEDYSFTWTIDVSRGGRPFAKQSQETFDVTSQP